MSFTLQDPGPPNTEFEQSADRAQLDRTAVALSARGFKAQVADSAVRARELVLAAIPEGAEVHIALSETMRELGITDEIDTSGRYDSIRARLGAMGRETQDREMRKLGAAPDYIVGSAHAVTEDGQIVVGSGSGSQLGAYAYAGGLVILVVGHRKLVPTSTRACDEYANTACRRIRPDAGPRLPGKPAGQDPHHPPRTLGPHHRHPRTRHAGLLGRLIGADDLEVLVDEDVVRPVDADVVDLVFAVAQLHNAVDDAPGVGGQRSFGRLIRCRSADDRPRPLTIVRWDLTDLLRVDAAPRWKGTTPAAEEAADPRRQSVARSRGWP